MAVLGMMLYILNLMNLKEDNWKLISVLAEIYYHLKAYSFLADEADEEIMNESD